MRDEGGDREREERGGKEGEGKEEGENNGWNATVTKGTWERGAGTEGEEGELTWACDHRRSLLQMNIWPLFSLVPKPLPPPPPRRGLVHTVHACA